MFMGLDEHESKQEVTKVVWLVNVAVKILQVYLFTLNRNWRRSKILQTISIIIPSTIIFNTQLNGFG